MRVIDPGLWFTDPANPDGPRGAVDGSSVVVLQYWIGARKNRISMHGKIIRSRGRNRLVRPQRENPCGGSTQPPVRQCRPEACRWRAATAATPAPIAMSTSVEGSGTAVTVTKLLLGR